MRGAHVVEVEGHPQCRYCQRDFTDDEAADEHIRGLARLGMLQDHIAIHWTTARW